MHEWQNCNVLLILQPSPCLRGMCQEPGALPRLWCEREASALPAMPRVYASTKRKKEEAASEANVA